MISPFPFYAFSWILVLILYSFNWTDIYPTLSFELLTFLLLTSIICFTMHRSLRRKWHFFLIPNADKYYNRLLKYTILLYVFFVFECIYSRDIPFMAYFNSTAEGALYFNFGIPVFHVLFVNANYLLCFFSAYCYFSKKKWNNHFLLIMILLLLLPLLYMSRGAVVNMLFGIFVIYILLCKNIARSLTFAGIFSLIFLYLFGVLGNIRMNNPQGDAILNIGKATDSFRSSFIPNEFFWGYIYIISPLGNLQYGINNQKLKKENESNLTNFVINEILPPTITKRMDVTKIDGERYLAEPLLNVGTMYFYSYLIYGYLGMWIIFVVMLLYCIIMLYFVPYKSIFYVPLIAVLSMITFFGLFHNMVNYLGTLPQLVFIYFFRKHTI